MMVESLDAREPLVLPAGTAIPAAVDAALARTADHVYDPVIVAGCVAETIEGFEETLEIERTEVNAIPPAQRALVREVEQAALTGATS